MLTPGANIKQEGMSSSSLFSEHASVSTALHTAHRLNGIQILVGSQVLHGLLRCLEEPCCGQDQVERCPCGAGCWAELELEGPSSTFLFSK